MAASAVSPVAAAAAAAGGCGAPIPNFDWSKHQWAFGVDAEKCIGCLRCVEACKRENNVPPDAHHFRTWVERYVTLEGEEKARIDSQADPVNIEASGAEGQYRFANRYKDAKVEKAFFVPKLCNHCTHPACVQVCPTGATYKTEDGVVLIDHTYCIGCQYCVQACPYGARYFNEEKGVTDKCTWCYHRITKGLQPACVEVCPVGARIFGDRNDKQSRDQPIHPKPSRAGAQTRDRQCSKCLLRRHRQGRKLMDAFIHASPFTGYVYPNETIIPWTVLIVVYPYLTGLVAGAFTISSLYQVFGFTQLRPVAHFALLVSLCCMITVPMPLLLHLGHPERAFNAMITPHVTSAFAVFGYAAGFYIILLVLETWFVFRPHIVQQAQQRTGVSALVLQHLVARIR